MKKAPEWTPQEFDALLQGNPLSPELLAARLPGRTADAIQVVRNGIHEYHMKGESTLLSKTMKQRLARPNAHLICPVCGEQL